MSDTPKLADESKKLLDNGWTIILYKNEMGSYSAVACCQEEDDEVGNAILDIIGLEDGDEVSNIVITDDFEPSQSLYRLTEKVFGRIV